MEAILQFISYSINDIDFKVIKNTKKKFSIGFGSSITQNGGDIVLDCKLIENDFNLSLKIIGKFELKGKLSDIEKSNLLSLNGTAILFPYLRSAISNITLLALNKAYVIPTMNIYKALGFENE